MPRSAVAAAAAQLAASAAAPAARRATKPAKPAATRRKPAALAVAATSSSSSSSSSSLAGGPPLKPSSRHADGVLRCWGEAFSGPAMAAYHDGVWGRCALPAGGSGRLLYKQLIMQTFQSGLSWTTILKKEPGFEARFARWDYSAVARWGEADVAAAMADAGIVRNQLKIRAAVANAAAAAALDAAAPGGFEAFVWRTGGLLPEAERLLQHASRSGDSYMRTSSRLDFVTADAVHPTAGVTAASQAFKDAGFRFLGPTTMLSFLQATGLVNHHKPDCGAFAPAEAAYAAGRARFSGGGGGAVGGGGGGGGGAKKAARAREPEGSEGAAEATEPDAGKGGNKRARR